MTDRVIIAIAWLALVAMGLITWWALADLESLVVFVILIGGICATFWALATILTHFEKEDRRGGL